MRRSFGRCLRRNIRATAGSPERASSMSAEQTAAASAEVLVEDARAHTISATSSSLSWRRPATSRPLGVERPVVHRAELLEHLDHAQELLPVGAA